MKYNILAVALCGQAAAQVITNDTSFYGQSEPVYPSPQASGEGDWASAYAQAQAFVAQLSIEEKVNLTGGFSDTSNGCSGNIYPIPRLGFPGMCVTDAGAGVRSTDFVSGFSSGIHVGASWNRNLTYARAAAMGGEFRAKGVNIALNPVVGPVGRVVLGGRNWEGFTNDPYLAGILVAESVTGLQSTGVGACTKHFIANEQETNRNPSVTSDGEEVASLSSNIDDTTMHELYLWPFADAVHAGTVSIMCSYERVNNSYGCQNSKTQNGLLKTELGFDGFVMSDWGAQHSGVASALAGMDMVMPSGLDFWGPNLTQAVQNGSVPESRLDDMATRIVQSWFHLQQNSGFPERGVGIPYDILAPHPIVDARDPAAKPTLLQSAVEGHVLVKNVNNALPLKTPKLLSIYGYDAKAPDTNYPSAGFGPWSLGLQSTDAEAVFCHFAETNISSCPQIPAYAPNGTLISGGGSGAASPSYISAPFDAIQERAIQDGTVLYHDFINVNRSGSVIPTTDACLVFINAAASEGLDRPALHDSYSDDLVTNIANQCNNTIVTIHNAGIRLVDQWIEHPNVTAVIFAHLPGQDSGHALTSILYGDVSPSGKLPYTVAKNESDYGALLQPAQPTDQYIYFPQDNFTEGVFIDYRAFDANNIEPRFEFGFGLTYTTFQYSDLVVSVVNNGSYSAAPTGDVIAGGAADLWDPIATATVTIANTGAVAAAEIPQLYVSIPVNGQPQKQLRGFEKVMIQPGESVTVEFEMRRRDLSVWDVTSQAWLLTLDTPYTVMVGSSSRNLPLNASLTL